MTQPVLLKVYGNLSPAKADLAEAVNRLCVQCCPPPEGGVCAVQGDLLTLSFEGIYFPVEEVRALLTAGLTRAQRGKLDVLDLEEWRLTRTVFAQGEAKTTAAPLNNVLDYSGH